MNTALGFQCLCPVAFSGPTCSILISPCLSQPCVASNTLNCTSNTSAYTCYCRAGFTGEIKTIRTAMGQNRFAFSPSPGPTCAQSTNSCSTVFAPCKNGGQCVNTANGYSCQCNALFQGSDCSIPVDPCSSNPCVASNSISCQITANSSTYSYSCTCRTGFTGESSAVVDERVDTGICA